MLDAVKAMVLSMMAVVRENSLGDTTSTPLITTRPLDTASSIATRLLAVLGLPLTMRRV